MTAPASIVAPFAAPAGRVAGSDGASSAAGGFEALLSLLGGEQQPATGGVGSKAADAADATTDKTADDAGASEAALASWLAQALGQTSAQPFAAPRPDFVSSGNGEMAASTQVVSTGLATDAALPSQDNAGEAADAGLPLPGGARAEGPIDLAALQALRPGAASAPPATPPVTEATPVVVPAPNPETDAPATAPVPTMVRGEGDPAAQAAAQPSAQSSAQAAPPAADAAPSSSTLAAEVAAAMASPDKTAEAAPSPATLPPEPKSTAGRRTAPGVAGGVAAPSANPALDSDPSLSPVEVAEAAIDDRGHDQTPADADADAAADAASEGPETTASRADGQPLAGRADGLAGAPASSSAHARATSETVNRLVAGIVDKLGGQASRFDLQLDPHGLGKVDVRVEIGADGRLAARLNFDNAQAASDLRGRAQDLRQALEQAGFSLGEGSLSFDFAGQNRDSGQSFDDSSRADQAGRVFARAMGALEDEAVLPVRFQTRRGLDLLI